MSTEPIYDSNGHIIRPHSTEFEDGASSRTTFDDIRDRYPSHDPRRLRAAQLATQLTTIPFCPYDPTPKQRKFLLDFSREALYGGAVGGAKSVGILMAALQFVEVPGYNALLLRKSFSDLAQPGALIPMADEWLRGNGPRWDQTEHKWTFPSGATLTFGYIERENDRLKYQGAAYHFVGFDELTQHKERDYRYLFSRMRRPKDTILVNVPVRMRATTNPGGPGHEWVYRRFIKPWELWKAGKGPRPHRNFHPSFLADNPHLDSDEYLEFLAELDPVTRAQLLRGDWNIRPEGRLFKDRWFVPIPDNPALFDTLPTVRFWDLAGTDPSPDKDPDWTAGAKLTVLPDHTVVIRDIVRFRASPGATERRVLNTAIADGYGVPIYMEQEPGQRGSQGGAQASDSAVVGPLHHTNRPGPWPGTLQSEVCGHKRGCEEQVAVGVRTVQSVHHDAAGGCSDGQPVVCPRSPRWVEGGCRRRGAGGRVGGRHG